MMKHSILTLVVVCASWSSGAMSQQHPLSPTLYYEMGGGTTFQRPLNEATVSPNLGVSAALNLPLSCDIWDQKIFELNAYPDLITDYMEGELDRLGQAIVAQLTALGQGVAVAALQRALPGVYDYSQTLTAQINGRVDVAKRSCEDVVNDVNKGINPLDGWKQIGIGVGWRSTLTSNENPPPDAPTSILEAQQQVARNSPTAPIPWIGGEMAGGTTNPIVVVRDLVTAGYNIFQSNEPAGAQSLTEPTQAAGDTVDVETIGGTRTEDKRLGVLFGTTENAVEWANRMVGEQTIYTCSPEDAGCASQFRPGVGLAVLVGEEVEELTEAWIELLGSDDMPSIDQLTAVSSNEVVLTTFVYEALQNFEVQDQNVYIGRLIDDVSLSRTIEKAMAIRRMILVSSESPAVKGYVLAGEVSEAITDRIRDEIDDLMWTVETQGKLSSKVSQTIIAYDALRDSVGSQTLTGGAPNRSGSVFSDRPTAPVN